MDKNYRRPDRPGQTGHYKSSAGPTRPASSGQGPGAGHTRSAHPAAPDRHHGRPQADGLETRLHHWLDLLVWVWRRRTGQPGASFVAGARLSDGELHELAKGVKALSRGLTGDRALAATSYMDDPALLGAYLLFYWPLSWAQAWTVLHDPGLGLAGFDPASPALDVGSGPGPVAFALLDCGSPRVCALDASGPALDLARELARARDAQHPTGQGRHQATQPGYAARLDTLTWRAGSPLPAWPDPATRPALATYGHVLNELPGIAERLDLVALVGRHLAAGGTQLAIEPALRTTSRDLLAFRDALLDPADAATGGRMAGARILGPCFYQGQCPALQTADQTCHGAVHWQVPGLVQRLAHAARLGKDEVAMAWLAWRGPGRPDGGSGDGTGAPGLVADKAGCSPMQPGLVAGGAGCSPMQPGPAPVKGVAGDPAPGRGTGEGEGLPPQSPGNACLYRVTGEAMLNKAGYTRLMVCGGAGAGAGCQGRLTLRMRREDLQAGGNLRQAGRVFFGLQRGDVIRLEHPVERETGLGVGEATRLERIERP